MGREIIWDFKPVNKMLLNVEASLQPLKQGCFLTAALWVPFCKAQKAWAGIESLPSREIALCLRCRHFCMLCTSTKRSLWFVPIISSQDAPEWPGAARILIPVHPRALQTACPGVPYIVLPYLMPHFPAREVRSVRVLWRGHLHLHLGHACKPGACTAN